MSQPNSSSMQDGFATFYAGEVDSPWIAYFGGDYTLNWGFHAHLDTQSTNTWTAIPR